MSRSAILSSRHAFALRALARRPSVATWLRFPVGTRTALRCTGLVTGDSVPRLTLNGAMLLIATSVRS